MGTLKAVFNSPKFLVLSDQAAYSGNSFLVTILLARLVALEHFGLFAGWVMGIYLAVSLVSALVIQPFQVMYARLGENRSYQLFVYTFQLVWLILFVGVAGSIFSFTHLLMDFQAFSSILIVYAVGFMIHDFLRKIWLAKGKLVNTLIIDLLLAVIQGGGIIFAGLLSWDFMGLLKILSLGYLPALLIVMLSLWRLFGPAVQWKDYFIQHYQQGKWLLLSAAIQWWSGNLFVVASGMLLGTAALGAFRLVQSLFGVLNILFQAFENYALPQTAKMVLESRVNAQQFLKKLNAQSLIVFTVILSIVFLLGDQIIVWAGGEQYASYGFLVKGMSVLYLLILSGYPIRLAIRALVLNKHFFIGYILTLAFSLVSFRYMIDEFQLMGALAGLIISQMILLVFWYFTLVKNNFLLWK